MSNWKVDAVKQNRNCWKELLVAGVFLSFCLRNSGRFHASVKERVITGNLITWSFSISGIVVPALP